MLFVIVASNSRVTFSKLFLYRFYIIKVKLVLAVLLCKEMLVDINVILYTVDYQMFLSEQSSS